MSLKLSRNFYLHELVKSQTALRHGIDNTPPDEVIEKLRDVATHILQPARDHFNVAIVPNSGYRCLELNRALGSKDTSQHIKGEAVDFEVPGVTNYDLARWIRDTLEFDQCILECYTPGQPHSGWVHCSYVKGENRGNLLTYDGHSYREGLIE